MKALWGFLTLSPHLIEEGKTDTLKKMSKTIELTILEVGTRNKSSFDFIIKSFHNLNNFFISSFSSVVKPYGFVL